MKCGKWVFNIAGVYGLLVVTPQFFLEKKVGIDTPPPITHPEFFYAFAGVALAWQFAFFMIANDPVRYRWIMIPSALEKIAFFLTALVLSMQGRLGGPALVFGVIDLIFAILFLISFWRSAESRSV